MLKEVFLLVRSRADLNRCTQFCRLVPNPSATGPFLVSGWQRYKILDALKSSYAGIFYPDAI